MNTNQDDILNTQRLIDGECNEAEIRSILQQADQQPSRWKEIATAFVEDQFWRRQFQSLEPKAYESQPVADLKSSATASHPDSTKPSPGNPRLGINWLAMAACITLAAMIGYTTGKGNLPSNVPLDPSVATNSTPAPPSENAEPQSIPRMTPASLNPDYHLQLVDEQGAEQGTILDGEVPLYAIDSPEQMAQIQSQNARTQPVSPDVLRQLTGRGFRMREDVNYISGSLKDGRQFLVPVRTINFVPGQ